jgi:hypothetical protein
VATERFSWLGISENTSLARFIQLTNQRLARWSDLLSRIQRRNFRYVSSDTTLTENDDIVQVDTTSGTVTVNLPAAAATPGKRYDIKKMVAANTVTLDAAGSDTIDGSATFSWATQYQNMTIESVVVTTPGVWGWVIV